MMKTSLTVLVAATGLLALSACGSHKQAPAADTNSAMSAGAESMSSGSNAMMDANSMQSAGNSAMGDSSAMSGNGAMSDSGSMMSNSH